MQLNERTKIVSIIVLVQLCGIMWLSSAAGQVIERSTEAVTSVQESANVKDKEIQKLNWQIRELNRDLESAQKSASNSARRLTEVEERLKIIEDLLSDVRAEIRQSGQNKLMLDPMQLLGKMETSARPDKRRPATVQARIDHMLAGDFRLARDLVSAERLARRSLEFTTQAVGEDDDAVIGRMGTLAGILYEQGRFAEVVELRLAQIQWYEKLAKPSEVMRRSHIEELLDAYLELGMFEVAEPWARQLCADPGTARGITEISPEVSRVKYLVPILQAQGKFEAAELEARRTLEFCKARGIEDGELGCRSTCLLVWLLRSQQKSSEAKPLHTRLVELVDFYEQVEEKYPRELLARYLNAFGESRKAAGILEREYDRKVIRLGGTVYMNELLRALVEVYDKIENRQTADLYRNQIVKPRKAEMSTPHHLQTSR